MDGRRLKAELVLQGIAVDDFLKDAKVDRNKYYRVMRGDSEFNRLEIQNISETLKLSDEKILDIFFNQEVS